MTEDHSPDRFQGVLAREVLDLQPEQGAGDDRELVGMLGPDTAMDQDAATRSVLSSYARGGAGHMLRNRPSRHLGQAAVRWM